MTAAAGRVERTSAAAVTACHYAAALSLARRWLAPFAQHTREANRLGFGGGGKLHRLMLARVPGLNDVRQRVVGPSQTPAAAAGEKAAPGPTPLFRVLEVYQEAFLMSRRKRAPLNSKLEHEKANSWDVPIH